MADEGREDRGLLTCQAVGARVKEYRSQRGLKQGELAARMGIGQSRLSDLERGGPWSVVQLLEAADALEVDPRDLLPAGRPARLGPLVSNDERALLELVRRGDAVGAVRLVLDLIKR